MKLKTTLILLFCFLFTGISQAQKIEIKKGIVYLDKVAILKSDSTYSQHSLYDLNDNEIIFVRFSLLSQFSNVQHNEFKFIDQRVTVEFTNSDYISLSKKRTVVNIIKWLLKEKVLTPKGKINPEKLAVFHFKYDEAISEKISIIGNTCNCNCEHEN